MEKFGRVVGKDASDSSGIVAGSLCSRRVSHFTASLSNTNAATTATSTPGISEPSTSNNRFPCVCSSREVAPAQRDSPLLSPPSGLRVDDGLGVGRLLLERSEERGGDQANPPAQAAQTAPSATTHTPQSVKQRGATSSPFSPFLRLPARIIVSSGAHHVDSKSAKQQQHPNHETNFLTATSLSRPVACRTSEPHVQHQHHPLAILILCRRSCSSSASSDTSLYIFTLSHPDVDLFGR